MYLRYTAIARCICYALVNRYAVVQNSGALLLAQNIVYRVQYSLTQFLIQFHPIKNC